MRLKEIEERKSEIRKQLEGNENLDLNSIELELKKLEDEKTSIEKRNEMLEKVKSGQTEFKLHAEPRSNQKPFKTFGEQMQAIVRASSPGPAIDNRLLEVRASGASSGIPSDGGFLIQSDFSSEIISSMYSTGIIAPLCRRIPISSNSNSLKINGIDESSRVSGSRWGGIRGYWANEAETVTSTKPKFKQIELSLNKLMALYYATDELLEDSSAMNAILSQGFADELKFLQDDAIIRGTGAGQPLGILNSGSLVTVDKETGQVADTLLFENVLNMWSRLIPSSQANAVWLVNQELLPQLYSMSLAVGVGGFPAYMPPNGISASPYGTIFGRPVINIEHCSGIGDVGDIILADFSNYMLASKDDIQTASSIHVKFIYGESTFRVTYRVDGRPLMNSTITPYKGSKTQSSFITLQAR